MNPAHDFRIGEIDHAICVSSDGTEALPGGVFQLESISAIGAYFSILNQAVSSAFEASKNGDDTLVSVHIEAVTGFILFPIVLAAEKELDNIIEILGTSCNL